MSPESDQEYFSDGITEEILNTLAKIRELKVAARTSAFAFKGRQIDMRAIGDSLGVSYLIEGSVRKAGNQLRITAQLIDAADGTHLWSDQYDRPLDDVFAIQTEIAQAIAKELRIPLGLDDPSALVTPTADLEAYDLYLAGLAQMRTRGAAVAEAARLFEAAIARDSTWAPAWAELAEAREILTWYPEGWDEPPANRYEQMEMMPTVVAALLDEAETAARQALVLDETNASAYVALGSVLRDRREWRESEDAYVRALTLDADNAEAHHQYGELLEMTGRQADALRSYERAVALDPAPVRRALMGMSLFLNDRAQEALPILRKAFVDSDHLPIIGGWLVDVLDFLGEYEESAQLRIGGGFDPEEVQNLTQALRAGDAELLPETVRAALTPVQWMLFDEPDRAAEALAKPVSPYEQGSHYYHWAPDLDAVRDSPQMQDMLRRLNLEGVQLQRTPPSEAPTP
jgi:TolB-like protein/Flp pilus assembly protein TadD